MATDPRRSESNHDDVRRSYDAVASEYEAALGDELFYKPLDRALLAAFLEQVEGGQPSAGPVADLGCGPGHVAAHLASLGATAVGIDLSPAMVELGRQAHPQVEFRQGDLLDLPASDSEFAGAIAFYSIIHLEPGELPQAMSEFWRVLRPGGLLLVAFHIGLEVVHREKWFGQDVDVDFHMLEIDDVATALTNAGFEVEARLERKNYPDEHPTRRAYLLARKAGQPAPR